MRRLRGLHIEDDVSTFQLVQKTFRTRALLQMASSRQAYLDLITLPALDFLILDAELPGWTLEEMAADLTETSALPLFIHSSTSIRNLGPLIALRPKAIVRKADGPQVLVDAVLSYFYAMEQFMISAIPPKS